VQTLSITLGRFNSLGSLLLRGGKFRLLGGKALLGLLERGLEFGDLGVGSLGSLARLVLGGLQLLLKLGDSLTGLSGLLLRSSGLLVGGALGGFYLGLKLADGALEAGNLVLCGANSLGCVTLSGLELSVLGGEAVLRLLEGSFEFGDLGGESVDFALGLFSSLDGGVLLGCESG